MKTFWEWLIERGTAYVILVAMILVCACATLRCQDARPGDPALSELERTKIQLLEEKQKTLSAEAALIRQAFEKNQQQGKALVDEKTVLIDAICRGHGFEPANCQLSADESKVTVKADPPKAKK